MNCKLICSSNTTHLQQLYAGFNILANKGMLKLKYEKNKNFCSIQKGIKDTEKYILLVELNKEKIIAYDTRDGSIIDENLAANVNFYFKRSFCQATVGGLNLGYKVFPLGLNYLVYNDNICLSMLKNTVLEKSTIDKFKYICSVLAIDKFLGEKIFYRPRLSSCENYPCINNNPKVLFLAKARNPFTSKSKEQIENKHSLNEMRAKCIMFLRKEFGGKFLGGFQCDDYSKRHFPECLVADDKMTNKSMYMKILKEYPICVATTGLHGSIGWKFAEYIAYAKSIVSEPLNYIATGNLEPNKNYLTFTDPIGCVEAVRKLYDNVDDIRYKMMENNFHYYHSYLRPDVLVFNTLRIAASGFKQK